MSKENNQDQSGWPGMLDSKEGQKASHQAAIAVAKELGLSDDDIADLVNEE